MARSRPSKSRKPPARKPATAQPAAPSAARRPPAAKTTSRTPLYLALAAVVVAAAVAIGIAASRGDDDGDAASTAEACEQLRADVSPITPATNPPELAPEVQSVTVEGDPLVPLPRGDGPECAIGSPAPTVTGSSFDGSPVTIDPADGTPKLLLFVAHWCPHCQAEVPPLADWIEAGENPPGVDIVTVSTGVDPGQDNYPPSTWLEQEGWPTPVLADDFAGSAALAYGLSAYPYYVVVDGAGVVADRWSGEIEPADLGTRVTDALA